MVSVRGASSVAYGASPFGNSAQPVNTVNGYEYMGGHTHFQCDTCHPDCATCDGYTRTDCVECHPGYENNAVVCEMILPGCKDLACVINNSGCAL